MTQNYLDVEHLVLSLPTGERRALAGRLLESLAEMPDSEVEAAWLEEARIRWQAYQQGTVSAASAEEVFDRLESRYR